MVAGLIGNKYKHTVVDLEEKFWKRVILQFIRELFR